MRSSNPTSLLPSTCLLPHAAIGTRTAAPGNWRVENNLFLPQNYSFLLYIHSSVRCTKNTSVGDGERAWGQPRAAKKTRWEDAVCWQQYWLTPWDGDDEIKWGSEGNAKGTLTSAQAVRVLYNKLTSSGNSVIPLGSAGPHMDNSVVPLSLKCLIYVIAHYHLCKALHS